MLVIIMRAIIPAIIAPVAIGFVLDPPDEIPPGLVRIDIVVTVCKKYI